MKKSTHTFNYVLVYHYLGHFFHDSLKGEQIGQMMPSLIHNFKMDWTRGINQVLVSWLSQ